MILHFILQHFTDLQIIDTMRGNHVNILFCAILSWEMNDFNVKCCISKSNFDSGQRPLIAWTSL